MSSRPWFCCLSRHAKIRSCKFFCTICILSPFIFQVSNSLSENKRYPAYQLKAAFIVNFSNFITWDKPRNNEGHSICSFGDDDVASSIASLISSDRMHERQKTLKYLQEPDNISDCDITFLGANFKDEHDESSKLQGGYKTLTISDTPGYAEDGGMIELIQIDGKIKVHLNYLLMKSQGFTADSRLLQLTTQVSSPKFSAVR